MDIKNVRKWCREFNEGRINVHDEQRSGRPSLPESTVARIAEMVRANRRITLEEIEDGLNENCSHFSMHKIVSETLGYRKVSARSSTPPLRDMRQGCAVSSGLFSIATGPGVNPRHGQCHLLCRRHRIRIAPRSSIAQREQHLLALALLESACWKWMPFTRGLFLVGRARAANSLVLSTIKHHLHAYLPEATIISKLQAHVARFIWGPDHTAWLPAGILARPVVMGGLGLMESCPQLSRIWEDISGILTLNHRVAPTTQLLDLPIISDCRFLRPLNLMASSRWVGARVRELGDNSRTFTKITTRSARRDLERPRQSPSSAGPSCPACGSTDGSLGHRYWSCVSIRPLVWETFNIVGRPLDFQAWIFGTGLEDDELAILASAKSRIYRYFVQVGLGDMHVNLATARGDITTPPTAASTSATTPDPTSLNWADSEMAEVDANNGYTVVKSKKRRLTSTPEHATRQPGRPAEKPSPQQRKWPTGPRAVPPQEIKATGANIADARARQATTNHENYVFVELPYLVGLANKDLANRLVADGLEIEGTTLKVFPFRKRAERIVVANLPGFVEDSTIGGRSGPIWEGHLHRPHPGQNGGVHLHRRPPGDVHPAPRGRKAGDAAHPTDHPARKQQPQASSVSHRRKAPPPSSSAAKEAGTCARNTGIPCPTGEDFNRGSGHPLGTPACRTMDLTHPAPASLAAPRSPEPRIPPLAHVMSKEKLSSPPATPARGKAALEQLLEHLRKSPSLSIDWNGLPDLKCEEAQKLLTSETTMKNRAHLLTVAQVARHGDQVESSRLDRILVPAGVLDRVSIYASSHYHISDHRLPRLAAILRSGLVLEHLAGYIRELEEDMAHDDDDGILWDRWTTIKAGLLAEARSLHDPHHAVSDSYIYRARRYIAAQLEDSSIRADYPSLPDLARAIRLRRPVSVIRDEQDNIIEGPELRRRAFATFQPCFARPTSDPAAGAAFIAAPTTTRELSEEDPLHRPDISPSEIANAIEHLPRRKAPGWDGLPCELLVAFKEDFFAEALARVFAASRLPASVDAAQLHLPHTQGPRRVLAAILFRRLKPHLRTLVPECQTYAVPGRSLSWNIAMVTDAIEEATALGSPLVVMGVDLESAFDSLDCGFLESLLTSLRLPPAFMAWINILYAGADATIRAGGFHTTAFPLLNGLRQGCAVSAALFSIATGPLLRRLESTLGVGNVIAYADDIVLLFHRDEEFEWAANFLEDFKRASGIAVNLRKSSGLWVLGLDIAPRSPVAHQEQHLLALLESACRRWTPFTRGLSLVGRARAANSLVGSTIQHHLHGYLPSTPTIAKLQARLARFVWGPEHTAWLPAAVMARPVAIGGLGLLDLATQLRLTCLKGVQVALRGGRNGFDWLVASSSEAWIRPPPDGMRLQPRRLRLLKLWEEASKILSLNHRAVPTSYQLSETLPENLRSHPMTLRSHGKTAESPEEDNCGGQINATSAEDNNPTYEEAMNSPEVANWIEAIEEERESLERHDVWQLQELPKGFQRNPIDPSIYEVELEEGRIILSIYVDDIFAISENQAARNKCRELLNSSFEVKYLGPISHMLGVSFKKSEDGSMTLSQSNYIEELLQRFRLQDAKGVSTPMETNLDLSVRKNGNSNERFPYRELIGGLKHWEAGKRVLRYLKSTKDFGITYRSTGKPLIAFSDASWASDIVDRKGVSGHLIILAGAPIIWRSTKQTVTALSTMESEYIALSSAAKDITWVRNLMEQLKMSSLICGETKVFCDNQAAISHAENYIDKSKTRHFAVKYHFVREKISEEAIELFYTPSAENPADFLTKPLARSQHEKKNVCFWCLLPGHGFKKCRIKPRCPVCGGKHYPIMCPTLEAQKTSHLQKAELKVSGESPATKQETANQFMSTTLNNTTVGGVYLQTLIVKISGPKGKHNVRVLLDCGSQRSYISKRMVDALGLKRVQQVTLTHNLFGGGEIRQKKHNVYKVNVSSLNNEYMDDLKFLDQEVICGHISQVQDHTILNELKARGINLTDICQGEEISIHMLIGSDLLSSILTGRMQILQSGVVATETKLGWTVMGPAIGNDMEDSCLIVTSFHVNSFDVQDLWKLDVLGIMDAAETKSRKDLIEASYTHFKETVKRDESGRYIVSLPWIAGHPPVPVNRRTTENRLLTTTRNVQGKMLYENYLPHRPVLKDSHTTPIRPVFDASCKKKGLLSLNQCLEKGDNLIELIPDLLLRFRLGKYGIIADMRKAFLQIQFVSNRVKEITTLTKSEDWNHVAGEHNPADLPSRGESPSKFTKSGWWEGPKWLQEKKENWSVSKVQYDLEAIEEERRKTVVAGFVAKKPEENPWYLNLYEGKCEVTLTQILRVIAKKLLRRLLGKRVVNYEEMVTILENCERVIYARPLTYIAEDNDDLVPLTPEMFLREPRTEGEIDLNEFRCNFGKSYEKRKRLLKEFRKRFRSKYLGLLVHHNNRKKQRQLKVGDIVLVEVENRKQINWPMGKITKVFPGTDNVRRLVEVKTKSGFMKRAVQRLLPLEVPSEDVEQGDGELKPAEDEIVREKTPGVESVSAVVRSSGGSVYLVSCNDCNASYVGETGRLEDETPTTICCLSLGAHYTYDYIAQNWQLSSTLRGTLLREREPEAISGYLQGATQSIILKDTVCPKESSWNEGLTLHHILAKLDIISKGESTTAYITYGVRCSKSPTRAETGSHTIKQTPLKPFSPAVSSPGSKLFNSSPGDFSYQAYCTALSASPSPSSSTNSVPTADPAKKLQDFPIHPVSNPQTKQRPQTTYEGVKVKLKT
ncbi:hypothetical protein LAZ67_10002163 [Cordylochernes scorpioides]|uniref:Reverse transcriptase domain-containing protein n=1 Tax=Cordylochernes scorpioides TaxID=51811 RepID=A0ABY6KWD9_9ARAC|nr:hypothetical protein LAZ67_10002163 [Cordylochernes scorpioides]